MNSLDEAACAGINRTAHKDTALLLADALNLAEPTRALFVAAAPGAERPKPYWQPGRGDAGSVRGSDPGAAA
jgi:hypothetical protein